MQLRQDPTAGSTVSMSTSVSMDRSAPAAPRISTRRAALSWIELIPLTITAIAVGGAVFSADYYLGDLSERASHPMHPLLRSSGTVGQSVGIVTLLGFLFLWLYPLRKALGSKRSLGAIPRWLDVHIAVGLSLPALGAVHSAWRFGGIIGLGFWAMIVVVLSGIAGRYLYTRVPRSRAGVELNVEQIAGEQRRELLELASLLELAPEAVSELLGKPRDEGRPRSLGAIVLRLVRDDFRRRRLLRQFQTQAARRGSHYAELDRQSLKRVRNLAMQQIRLGQQLRMLEQTQRLLKLWHVAHRPVAVTAFLAVLTHVVVVVLMGATWFW
jgi:hypothetical protein